MPAIEVNAKKRQRGLLKIIKFSTTDCNIHQLAFDNAVQANIITIARNGKIIIANNAACKLLGYSPKELLTKSRSTIFDINEAGFKKMLRQRTAEGQSIAMVTVIKKNGDTVPCQISSAVFMDGSIKKAITIITDMSQTILGQKNIDAGKDKMVADNIASAKTKQKAIDTKKEKIVADNIILAISKQKAIDIKKEKIVADDITAALVKSDSRLEKNNEWIKYIARASYDVMWDWDIASGEIYAGDSIEEVFGYTLKKNTIKFTDFSGNLLEEEKDAVEKKLFKALASKANSWNDSFMLKRKDGSAAMTSSRAGIVRNEKGKATHLIGSTQDISWQKEMEEKLEQQIKLTEKQVEEAMVDAKMTERSDIGKELHDNVNQLLAASKMSLDMAKRGGEKSQLYLSRSTEYTNIAIEEIRKLTQSLTTDITINLGLCESIEKLASDTMEVSSLSINCILQNFKEKEVNDKFKINVFRIVQEQLTNILKHAEATKVSIGLSQNKGSVLLAISDNGIGFDTAKKQKGIGIANIKSRAASYNATTDFVSAPGHGCVLKIQFPIIDIVLSKKANNN